MPISVYRTQVSAHLLFKAENGKVEKKLPVISTVMNFGINAIPRCEIELALGVNTVSQDQTVSLTEEIFQEYLKESRECEVIAKFQGEFDKSESLAQPLFWDQGEVVLFRGRIDNYSIRLTGSSASITLFLSHWLGDLLSGSLLSPDVHFILTNNPVYTLESENVLSAYTTRNRHHENLEEDLWGKGYKQLVLDVLESPRDLLAALPDSCVADDFVQNPQKVLDAWRRIEGSVDPIDRSDPGLDYSDWAPVLSFKDVSTKHSYPLATTIAETLVSDSRESFARSTVWSHLVGKFCKEMQLMVVPRINSAIIAPFFPSARVEPGNLKSINADSILQADNLAPIRSPPRGVIVRRNMFNMANASLASRQPACWFPSGEGSGESYKHNHRMLWVNPPVYLNGIYMGITMEGKKLESLVGGVHKADESDTGTSGGGGGGGSIPLPERQLLENYAKSIYYEERLRNRKLTVMGKLRLDIAPGTLLKVNLEEHRPKTSLYRVPVYGMVEKLSIAIDAKRGYGMTSFELNYVRNEEEQNSDFFTAESHPFYDRFFTYAPLAADGFFTHSHNM